VWANVQRCVGAGVGGAEEGPGQLQYRHSWGMGCLAGTLDGDLEVAYRAAFRTLVLNPILLRITARQKCKGAAVLVWGIVWRVPMESALRAERL